MKMGLLPLPTCQPANIVENQKSYPLTDLLKSESYTLDFDSKTISGPQVFSFTDIDEILYLPHRAKGESREIVAVRIRLGPLLAFENFESEAIAELHMERIVMRLHRQDPICSSYFSEETGDALKAVGLKKIVGLTDLQKVQFLERGILIPMMISLASPASGTLFLSQEGMFLYDGLGRKKKICELKEISDLTKKEETLDYSNAESSQIVLNFTLDQTFKIELRYIAQQIHDGPVPGEHEKSEKELKIARGVYRKIRKYLGMGDGPPK